MNKFYYFNVNGSQYYDYPLQATNWKAAINEAKSQFAYQRLYFPKYKKKSYEIADYIEVYKNKLRKDLSFDDLKNPEMYRKIYKE